MKVHFELKSTLVPEAVLTDFRPSRSFGDTGVRSVAYGPGDAAVAALVALKSPPSVDLCGCLASR
jgi:hypothetical protein